MRVFCHLLQNDHLGITSSCTFLSDPGIPGVRSMGPSVSNKLTHRGFADFTELTLADEDTNSILSEWVSGFYFILWYLGTFLKDPRSTYKEHRGWDTLNNAIPRALHWSGCCPPYAIICSEIEKVTLSFCETLCKVCNSSLNLHILHKMLYYFYAKCVPMV